jgi:transcriptional regulator with XRE-family HTH domain
MQATLRTLREEQGIKQSWFAEQLGIHRSTYINYEQGKTRVPKAILFYAAHLLHVSPDVLTDAAHS